MLVMLATIPSAASPSSSELAGGAAVAHLCSVGEESTACGSPQLHQGLAAVAHLRSVVEESTACALPGVSVKYDSFIPCMWQAVGRGFVTHELAVLVGDGLRHGFRAGIEVTRMHGHRWFQNYKSAVDGREAVTRATMKRVEMGKTVQIGVWNNLLASALRTFFPATAIFPLGAVPKPLEPNELRPTSDHTRTGLNGATDLGQLRHSLNTYQEIAWFLRLDYFMRVSDVEAAFPLLPLHPDVWPFFLFRFYADQTSTTLSLFLHVCGDFGAAGMPGTFKVFFDVVCGMARSVQVLTLPMCVYVDDCGLIGPEEDAVNAEMEAFHTWAAEVCGVLFKFLKDRLAAQRQLMLGFWWDSTTLTRTLDERKLVQYMDMLAEFATRPTLSLREMQSVAGRMQRAIMTFPPGAACFLVSVFVLMAGLRLPWHKRRTTRAVRGDFKFVHRLLSMNLGRGYYSYANFKRAPECQMDASKSKAYTGGGFVSKCGLYDFFKYGTRAKRHPIDELEGDTATVCASRLAKLWRGCIVPFFIDNSAFQRSGAKGRSLAVRLNNLLRELFMLQVAYEFIIEWWWISTHDNINADHLSRDREDKFLVSVYESGFWSSETVPQRMEGAGRTRSLPEVRGVVSVAGLTPSADDTNQGKSIAPYTEESNGYSKNPFDSLHRDQKPEVSPEEPEVSPLDDATNYISKALRAVGPTTWAAPARGVGLRKGSLMLVLALFGGCCVQTGDSMPLSRHAASLSYAHASVFDGLPADLMSAVEDVMDNRLSSSSWRTVKGGIKIWREVADLRGWPPIITSDDPMRGGKLAAFVMHMVQNTDLVYGSIEKYIWGVRTFMQVHHEADPQLGVRHWENFMSSVKVLTWVPAEPRRRCPTKVVKAILEFILENHADDFFWNQMAFLIVLLLFTFSRSECPCPKAFTGRECYDKAEHFNVGDFDIRHVGGRRALFVRFRAIKQDKRVERPEAAGDGDWAVLGEIPGSHFCPIMWFLRLQRFYGHRPDKRGPFFLDPDGVRPLIYGKALDAFHDLQRAVNVSADELAGLHGLRVEGHNSTKNGLGAGIAQAHGLWKSNAVRRYDRYSMGQVVRIPAVIMGVDPGDNFAPSEEARTRGPPARRMRRSDVQCREAARQSDVGSAAGAGPGEDRNGDGESDPASDVYSGEASDAPSEPGAALSAAHSLLHLTPSGHTAAQPAGYWGQQSTRRGPARRAQSPPTRRRSPFGSPHSDS